MHHVSKLKNGITLIQVPVKGTKAVTVLAMFPVGSRYEEREISGASHFVEHLMFKGTKKRPKAIDISRILDAVGAQYNAFTSKEYTGYYIKIMGSKQELAYDLLSDMIFNSEFKAEEIEKEKGPIIEELRMYSDNPLMDIEENFEELMYGDMSLGWKIVGTEETLRAMNREKLWNYYQKHYSPQNMVLVLAGDIEKNKSKLLKKYFENHSSPRGATKLSYYQKNYKRVEWKNEKQSLEERVVVKEKKVDQTQVVIGFPGLPSEHKDRYVQSVLSTILGGGMSSRLFSEVREKRGLAYMVRASVAGYRDAGSIYVQAGLNPSRLEEAVKVIREELKKMTTDLVGEEELKDAKSNLIGHLALQMEDSHNQANWYAEKFLFSSKLETYEQVVKNIKAVTAASIKKLAQKLFIDSEVRLAAIGPFSKEKFLKTIETSYGK
jgi:predicted Zn-dependent peptidase